MISLRIGRRLYEFRRLSLFWKVHHEFPFSSLSPGEIFFPYTELCLHIHTYIYTYMFSLSHSLSPHLFYVCLLSIYLSIYLIYLSSVSLPLIHSQVISLKSSTRKHITRQCSPETFKFPSQVPLLGGKLGGGLISKSCLTLATPWIVACQDPMSIGFSRQEY